MTVAGQITDELMDELIQRSTHDRNQFQPSSRSWAMHNGYVSALTELQHRREAEAGTPDIDMARHWIDRYAAGIDEEPQMSRILDALGVSALGEHP